MRFAVVKDNMVTTVIIANIEQKEELETALNASFEDASVLGLTVGDFWNGVAWTRNIDGEQVVIEPVVSIEDRVTTLEESNAEMTEALDLILSGVTE